LQQLQPSLLQHLRRQAAAGSGDKRPDLHCKQIPCLQSKDTCCVIIVWCGWLLLLQVLLSLPLHRSRCWPMML
jgi:hypothetical protein